MKSKLEIIATVIALLIVGGQGSACFGVTSITLEERIAMRSSVVRLGDVAAIKTADRAQSRQLAAILLLPAPAPGTERYLQRREVADLLAAHGLDLREIDFSGADRVAISTPAEGDKPEPCDDVSNLLGPHVNRHAEILSGGAGAKTHVKLDEARAIELHDQFCRIITEYVSAKTGQPGQWRATCNVDERFLALLDAKTSQPTCQGGKEPWSGRQRFVVSFATTQGKVSVPIHAEVAAPPIPVVVATRLIARGDVITASQLEVRPVENVPRPTDRRAACDSIEKIVGMQARQAIPIGEVVFTDQIVSPTLVRRGDVVTVTTQGGGIRVRTSARARQDGARGDLVQVESLDADHARFDVQVVGPRDTAICVISDTTAPEPSRQSETVRRPTRSF